MTAPRIRVGDADRQQSVDRLARHFTDGRIDSTEYDQRVRRAYAAVYLDELPALFSDLPAEPTTLDDYQKAWRHGHGLVDRGAQPGYRGGLRPVRGLRRRRGVRVARGRVAVDHAGHPRPLFSRPADLDRVVRVDRRPTTPPPPRPTLVKPAAAQRHTVQV